MLADIQELAREQCPEALETLSGIMQSKKAPAAARVAAANSLLDRGYGKPLQQSEITTIEPGSRRPEDMTDAELVAILDKYQRTEAQQASQRGGGAKAIAQSPRAFGSLLASPIVYNLELVLAAFHKSVSYGLLSFSKRSRGYDNGGICEG